MEEGYPGLPGFFTAHPENQIDIIFAVIDDRMQKLGQEILAIDS